MECHTNRKCVLQPSYNEIVFPAAILQPPFYNYQADEAVNMVELVELLVTKFSWF
jgi:predicted metalloendopeptidase